MIQASWGELQLHIIWKTFFLVRLDSLLQLDQSWCSTGRGRIGQPSQETWTTMTQGLLLKIGNIQQPGFPFPDFSISLAAKKTLNGGRSHTFTLICSLVENGFRWNDFAIPKGEVESIINAMFQEQPVLKHTKRKRVEQQSMTSLQNYEKQEVVSTQCWKLHCECKALLLSSRFSAAKLNHCVKQGAGSLTALVKSPCCTYNTFYHVLSKNKSSLIGLKLPFMM